MKEETIAILFVGVFPLKVERSPFVFGLFRAMRRAQICCSFVGCVMAMHQSYVFFSLSRVLLDPIPACYPVKGRRSPFIFGVFSLEGGMNAICFGALSTAMHGSPVYCLLLPE